MPDIVGKAFVGPYGVCVKHDGLSDMTAAALAIFSGTLLLRKMCSITFLFILSTAFKKSTSTIEAFFPEAFGSSVIHLRARRAFKFTNNSTPLNVGI